MEHENEGAQDDPFSKKFVSRKAFEISRNPVLRDLNRADIEQEFFIHIAANLYRYDPRRGRLSTFVIRIVENRISSLIRERRAAKHEAPAEVVSLDELVPDENGELIAFHETVDGEGVERRCLRSERDEIESLELSLDVQNILELLSDELKAICRELAHHDIVMAAKRLGTSRPTIYRRIEEIRERFRESCLNEYLEKV